MTDQQRAAYNTFIAMRGAIAFCWNQWLTVMLIYHATITNDPLLLILIGVIHEGTTFLFEIPTGLVADLYSRKWSVIIGLFIMSVAFLIEGLLAVYIVVLFASFLGGLGFTFISGAHDAWIVDEIGTDNAAQAYLRGSQVTAITGQLGILSAIAIGRWHVSAPIVVAGVGMLILGIASIIFMTETGFVREEPDPADTGNSFFRAVRQNISLVRQSIGLRTIVTVGIIIGLGVGAYDRLYTPYFVGSFNLSESNSVIWLGGLFAAQSITSAIALSYFRPRTHLISKDRVPLVIAICFTGTIIGNLGFVFAPTLIIACLCFWFSQTLRSITRPLIIIWTNHHAAQKFRATAISMYWQSNALGQIVGSPLIGFFGQVTTLRTALITAILALAPTLPILTLMPSSNVEHDPS